MHPLVNPSIGLIIWTGLVFLILLVLLKKFAWKPILNAVKEREENIEGALKAAEDAKAEMEKLQASNEELLVKAREERDAMLKEATAVKNNIIAEAKAKANEDAERIVDAARETIKNEKLAAMSELKNSVAQMSIEIAEKVVREKLSSEDSQQAYVEKLLAETSLN